MVPSGERVGYDWKTGRADTAEAWLGFRHCGRVFAKGDRAAQLLLDVALAFACAETCALAVFANSFNYLGSAQTFRFHRYRDIGAGIARSGPCNFVPLALAGTGASPLTNCGHLLP